MILKIALIYGGRSVEHEVSILTALQCYQALNEDKYEGMLVYINKDNEFYIGDVLSEVSNYENEQELLSKCKKVYLKRDRLNYYFESEGLFKKKYHFDVALPLVHGKGVEDGTIYSLLSFYDIPYVGTSHINAGLSQDKVLSKMILEANNLSVVPYFWFYKDEYLQHKDELINKAKELGYPVIVKASMLGSSIGIYKCDNEDEFIKSIDTIIYYDNKILVEKAIVNIREINCALFKDGKNLVIGELEEVIKSGTILSYEDKYLKQKDSKDKRIIPALVDDKIKEDILTLAKKSYYLLNNSSLVRIDFIIDKDKNIVYFNEINTIPGSLAHYLFDPMGLIYPNLIDKMVNVAIKDYLDNKMQIKTYQTSLLSGYSLSSNKIFK